MNKDNWIESDEDKIKSLLGDEAKSQNMLDNIEASVRQLKAKSSFRLALLNQLMEKEQTNDK